jgi:hypothetical protein
MNMSFLAKTILPVLLLGTALTGCSQNNTDNTSTTSTTVLESDANPTRVLLAAILLATGDIEKALSDGLVTVADIDAATAAITNGTLDAWRERAEADFNG